MSWGAKLTDYYFANYKKVMYIPFIMLFISLILLGVQYNKTGDFIIKDISLKGGVALTIIEDTKIDQEALEQLLRIELAPNDVSVRIMRSAGRQKGFLIESDIVEIDQEKLTSLLIVIGNHIGKPIDKNAYSLETMGASLGSSFFNQVIRAIILAFFFMGIVVFIYFRSFIPSLAVILSAFSDIVITIAIVNIMGMKLGTAGIAALLMLISYSIDTDIMLTTRVLKRKDLDLREAIVMSFKTGMTMTLTTISAITVALFFVQSEVIRQIMVVLLIGLFVDIIMTWIQNTGLLIWYVKRPQTIRK